MAEIAKAMTKGRFGSAIVVDGNDRLAGIVDVGQEDDLCLRAPLAESPGSFHSQPVVQAKVQDHDVGVEFGGRLTHRPYVADHHHPGLLTQKSHQGIGDELLLLNDQNPNGIADHSWII